MVLDPENPLYVKDGETILCAASLEQARIVYRFAADILEAKGGYKFSDSKNTIGIRHVATRTRLRVISSSGKRAMGLGVNNPFLICDEPGSWEVRNGELMYDAIQTSLGKPGQRTRAVFIGTLAPATGGWWHDLVDTGSHGSVYVQKYQGNPDRWDNWNEIRKANPLSNIDSGTRRKLLAERDAARADSRLKARFLSYRLNVPTGDDSDTLVTADDWKLVRARTVPARDGRPIVGIDLGGGRSWSAAVAIFPNGRCEAISIAPGIPTIEKQERRDLVPAGTYRRLLDAGSLRMVDGVRVPPAAALIDWIRQRWGVPALVVSDRFRVNELRDCQLPCPLEPRVSRWSESASDIRALRKMVRDGPLATAKESDSMIL